MQKGDEVDDVMVIEIKLVLAEQFSNLTLTKSPPKRNYKQNSLRAHLTHNPIVAGTTCEGRLHISTS